MCLLTWKNWLLLAFIFSPFSALLSHFPRNVLFAVFCSALMLFILVPNTVRVYGPPGNPGISVSK
jgi:hypothetical protein